MLGETWLEAKKTDPKKASSKKSDDKASDSKSGAKGESSGQGKPVQVGSYGDWGAFVAQGGREKTCYALASPKDRSPPSLKRDPAYIFVSTRPAEKVRNEVALIMGFALKDGAETRAEINGSTYDFIGKGANAWIKNPAEEGSFLEALKKGSKLTVKASSVKSRATVDTYSLAGLSQALEKVQKECQ